MAFSEYFFWKEEFKMDLDQKQVNLTSIYDDQAQKDLFEKVIKDHLESNPKSTSINVYHTFTELFNALFNYYETQVSLDLDRISDDYLQLAMYLIVDYAAMLRDDLLNKKITITQGNNGYYYVFIRPEMAGYGLRAE